ncbi:MAG TPA: hypothetical protein VJ385_03255 [Fibrobacteria bacterium]|nr:hypothetical protein [Fibrobacteria bacterium]
MKTGAIIAFLGAALLGSAAMAVPDITGPEARAFLGGRTGKIVYLKNQVHQLYFLDLSDSVLVERQIADDYYCGAPMIHPDGSRIVYESNAGIFIRNLEERSATRWLVYAGVGRNGLSLEPHWWINPANGDEYVIYTTGDIADLTWPPRAGQTYVQKIDKKTNAAVGPPTMLLPFMMASGRSKDGKWGGTSHHSTGMYKFYPERADSAFFAARNWQDSGGWGACNGSINPSNVPAHENRLMHLTSGYGAMGGVVYENHKAIVIRTWDDKDVNSPLWFTGIPGVHCNNDGSGNQFWDHPEWSSDEEYFTAVGSKIIQGYAEADLYMGRISFGGDNQIRRVLKGGGLNHYPHLWIKQGTLPAKIGLNKTALEFTSLKKDAANPRPDTVKVRNTGDGTLPALKTGALPAWLKVRILANGTNAPLLETSVDRTGLALGTYTATVQVAYGQWADSASYTVRFKYADPVLTSLKPVPGRAVLLPGDTVRFRAQALDQAGQPFAGAPSVSWEALGDLPVSADGLVEADSAVWRVRAFRGSAGAVSCTTQVTVARLRLRIDAGAAEDSLPPGWTSDRPYASAWPRASLPGVEVDAKAASDPAPDAVYRSVRYPEGPYLFDGLPNGRYAVRFHFASPFPDRTVPAQGMSIKMEGVRLLEDVRLPARPDNGLAAASRDLEATVSDGNGLSLEFEGASGAVALAGLEIHDVGAPPLAVTKPVGKERYRVGDTLRVRWETDGTINSVGIQFSPDGGRKWIPVTRRSSVNLGQADWGDYAWVIPDSLDGSSLVSDSCVISVYDYFGGDRDRNDAVFSILPAAPITGLRAARGGAEPFRIESAQGGRLSIRVDLPGEFLALLTDLRGRVAASASRRGPGGMELSCAGLARGVYRLSLSGGGLGVTRKLTLLD